MRFGELKENLLQAAQPEQKPEQVEHKENEPVRESAPAAERQDAAAAVAANAQPAAPVVPAAPPAPPKDVYHVQVERILEENLVSVYLSMPPAARAQFKATGEATALKVRAMLEQAKVKAKDVLKLIMAWLKLIPAVNRYFLDQEAKIKTDKILLLAAERQREKESQT